MTDAAKQIFINIQALILYLVSALTSKRLKDLALQAMGICHSPVLFAEARLDKMKTPKNYRSKTLFIVGHVTATNPTDMSNDALFSAIRNFHVNKNGWREIGYNFLVFPDGEIIEGRGWDEIGAHVLGYNSVSLGIALVGGKNTHGDLDKSTLTEKQMTAFWALTAEACRRYPEARVCGHRDLSPDINGDGLIDERDWLKLCPLFDMIPEAARRGLPAALIGANWAAEDGRRPIAPDEKMAYLQKLLTRAGIDIVVDGHYGPQTAAGLRRFQKESGISRSGKFDPVTVSLLREQYDRATATPRAAAVDGIDKTAAESSTVWTSNILGGFSAALVYFSEMPFGVQIAAFIAIGFMVGYLVRERMRKAESARRAARGERITTPQPDFLDHVFAVAASFFAPREAT